MPDDRLPAQRAHRDLRDKNQNRQRQPNIPQVIESLADEIKFHMRKGKIQENARDRRLQHKSE